MIQPAAPPVRGTDLYVSVCPHPTVSLSLILCVCACAFFSLPLCPSSFPPQDPRMYCDLCLEGPWLLQVCLLLSSDDISSARGSPISLTSSPSLSSPGCFSNVRSKFLPPGLCPGCLPCLSTLCSHGSFLHFVQVSAHQVSPC